VKLDIRLEEDLKGLQIWSMRITVLKRVEDLEHHFDILLAGTHDWFLTPCSGPLRLSGALS
jgi:hypothetical protein